MEYEIGDDPQGLPDCPEGDRDGGLPENVFFRKGSGRRHAGPNDLVDPNAPVEQLGELA